MAKYWEPLDTLIARHREYSRFINRLPQKVLPSYADAIAIHKDRGELLDVFIEARRKREAENDKWWDSLWSNKRG